MNRVIWMALAIVFSAAVMSILDQRDDLLTLRAAQPNPEDMCAEWLRHSGKVDP